MNITVTGSLGYVSTPLIQELVAKGHAVTVVSSDAVKQPAIEARGARAAIGGLEDAAFLTAAFRGADAVYAMLAPYGNFADPANTPDKIVARAEAMARNYVQAIQAAGVQRVVYLSSIGAHTDQGNGLIRLHHQGETTLRQLPAAVSICFVRAAGFYKNLLAYVPLVKHQGRLAARYGGDDRNVFVAATDIAAAVAAELAAPATGRTIRYAASDELSCTAAAGIIGAAVGKPDLPWVILSAEQQLAAYTAHGMNEAIAREFVEMNESIHTGRFYEDYDQHKPELGKVKMPAFAQEFAAVYHQP